MDGLPPKPTHSHKLPHVPHFMLSTTSHDAHVSPREDAVVHHSPSIHGSKLPHFMQPTVTYSAHHEDSSTPPQSARARSRSPAPSLSSQKSVSSNGVANSPTPHYMLATTTSEHHTHRELDAVHEPVHSDRSVHHHHHHDGPRSSNNSVASSLSTSTGGPVPHYMQQTSASDKYFHSFEHKALEADEPGHHTEHSNGHHHHHKHSHGHGSASSVRSSSSEHRAHGAQSELEAAVRSLHQDFVGNSMHLSESELLGGSTDN
jgi:hypothetical protein